MPDAAAISSMHHARTMQDVSYAVARKALDNARARGDAAVSLLQAAADLQKSTTPNPTTRPLGPGQTISVVA